MTLIQGQPDVKSETLTSWALDLITSVHVIHGTGKEEKLKIPRESQVRTNPEESAFHRKSGCISSRLLISPFVKWGQ